MLNGGLLRPKQLLLACGRDRQKKLFIDNKAKWTNLVTLDMNPANEPDVVHDLMQLPWPFKDNSADECHAYDIIEHLGTQGDYLSFFALFSEVWRILIPGGAFFGISPHWSSPWAWGDPGHSRAIGPEIMTFLCQRSYSEQVGKSPMSDYRFCYKADFEIVYSLVDKGKQYQYVLKAIKPSRCEAR